MNEVIFLKVIRIVHKKLITLAIIIITIDIHLSIHSSNKNQ